MQHSDQPFNELERARQALRLMKDAKDGKERLEHWIECLHRIERIWSKATSHYGKSPKWNGWQGPYLKQRKGDPLLSYLVNARGAEEHTISDVAISLPEFIGIETNNGKLAIHKGKYSNGGVLFDKDPRNLTIGFSGRFQDIGLLPIENRGRKYEVPKSHLGHPLDPSDVISVGEKAIAFYEKMLHEAEKFFVDNAKQPKVILPQPGT